MVSMSRHVFWPSWANVLRNECGLKYGSPARANASRLRGGAFRVTTYPLPLPKPSRPLPLATNPDGTWVYTDSTGGEDDAMVNAKMNGICRGC